MKYFLIILLFITSCSIEKRIDKATKKWCQFCEADSLTIYKTDTLLKIKSDTLVIEKFTFNDTIIKNDTIIIIRNYHSTKVIKDTVFTTLNNYITKTKTLKPIIKKVVVNSSFATFSIWYFVFSIIAMILVFLWYRIFER